MTGPGETPKDPTEKILQAAGELKEAITDAKAKLLLSLEAAVKVGYQCAGRRRRTLLPRPASNNY
jgi:hypothetical protein